MVGSLVRRLGTAGDKGVSPCGYGLQRIIGMGNCLWWLDLSE